MKARIITAALLFAGITVLAAAQTPSKLAVSPVHFADSTSKAIITMEVDMPSGSGVAGIIRDNIITSMVEQLEFVASTDQECHLARYNGQSKAAADKVWFYGRQAVKALDRATVFDELCVRPSEFRMKLKLYRQTSKYVEFVQESTTYTSGCVHGNRTRVFTVYRKSDGSLVGEILDRKKSSGLQALVIDGLIRCFSAYGIKTEAVLRNYLKIPVGESIPLPSYECGVSAEGVIFVYQDEEIAPHAVGCPEFVVPFDRIRDFLSAEAALIL